MERFEYKIVKAPIASIRYTGSTKSDDLFAQTLMDTMNEVAADGWQFVRKEIMSETKRTGLFGRKTVSHDYMVYRRQLRSNGLTLDEPVSPRRVAVTAPPDIEQLRARISKVMLEPNLHVVSQ